MSKKFSEWLKMREAIFGQPIEEPVQDPSKLNNGAFPRYEAPVVPKVKIARIRRSNPHNRIGFN